MPIYKTAIINVWNNPLYCNIVSCNIDGIGVVTMQLEDNNLIKTHISNVILLTAEDSPE